MKAKGAPKQSPTIVDHILSTDEGRDLVRLTRRAIETYLTSNRIVSPPENCSGNLRKKSGVFVTLNTVKPPHELRGCIGFPYPTDPLVEAAIKAGIYAATEDPRFSPLPLDEFKQSVVVELSVLTPPQTLKTSDCRELPSLIQVGRDGLIIQAGRNSGLLLPQVAVEWNWDTAEFLTNCCLKAGLPPDSWLLSQTNVMTFQAEIFEEVEPGGEIRRRENRKI